jgi:HK97 family phage portal protein
MSAFDMIYKTITQLYINNNSYTLIQRDGAGNIVGFYPINASTVEFLEYQNCTYVQFTFWRGQKVTVSYDDVVHLRRHFNKSDMFGDSNDAILSTLQLSSDVNQGISNAIRSSHKLKGLLKITGSLKTNDLKKQKDAFVSDYMTINNVGGIAALDNKAEYTPLSSDPKFLEAEEMEVVEGKIFKYFNISKEIITSNYDENQWNSFYESVIEPLAIQLSLEFTHKCFTERERGFGNKIIFESNRLNYASNQTKTAMCKELVSLGIFSINEARELFNLSPLDEDKRIISLNYVDAAKQNEYQLGQDDKKKEGEGEDGK